LIIRSAIFDYPQRDAGRVFRSGQLKRENCELIASKPCHQVVFSTRASQTHGNVDEDFVADAMAVQVIDTLERV
jgi:hypothetical protein